MPEVTPFLTTRNYAILNGMEQHDQHIQVLMSMMAVLRERQSSWELTPEAREKSRKGIIALQAAVDAMSIQIYA